MKALTPAPADLVSPRIHPNWCTAGNQARVANLAVGRFEENSITKTDKRGRKKSTMREEWHTVFSPARFCKAVPVKSLTKEISVQSILTDPCMPAHARGA
jgi:hypothetical protein